MLKFAQSETLTGVVGADENHNVVGVERNGSSVRKSNALECNMTCPPNTGPGVVLDLGRKGGCMGIRRRTVEEIITKLREAEVGLAQGETVGQVCRQLGVSEQTFYRWRREYGGLRMDQAKRLKQLETENTRLRRAVSDLTLDNQILKEVARGN